MYKHILRYLQVLVFIILIKVMIFSVLAEYPNGYTLLAFDLTPDSSASAAFHTSPQCQRSVRLERFILSKNCHLL